MSILAPDNRVPEMSVCARRLTNRWSRRGYRRDKVVDGWEAALRVVVGAGHGPPRGSAPP